MWEQECWDFYEKSSEWINDYINSFQGILGIYSLQTEAM